MAIKYAEMVDARIDEKENAKKNATLAVENRYKPYVDKIVEMLSRVTDIVDTANYSFTKEGWQSPCIRLTAAASYTPVYGMQLAIYGCRRDGFEKKARGVAFNGTDCKLLVTPNSVTFISDYNELNMLAKHINPYEFLDKWSAEQLIAFVELFDQFEQTFYDTIKKG